MLYSRGKVFVCLLLVTIWSFCKSGVMGLKTHNEDKLPTIIWWSKLLYPHVQKVSKIECLKGCCISTSKRAFRNSKNIISFIFYGTDFSIENLPLPKKSNHVWALLHEESPMNNFIFSHIIGIQNFNYTATFSRASDFPLTTQFISSLQYLTQRPSMSLLEKNIYRKKGIAPIMYMQSHCNVASDRDFYVKELMKYVEIDSYGQCLHNKDLPLELVSTENYDKEEFLTLISKYKFHIAFENAICDDYITEKLFRPLHVGSVPIYMGSHTAQDWTPSKKSVIEVNDFASPSELATFIRKLDEDDDLYNEYLTFKHDGVTNLFLENEINQRNWGVNDPMRRNFIEAYECYICDKLTELSSSSFMPEPRIANRKHMDCPQPKRSLDVETKVDFSDEWWQEDWIENYWFSFDQAKALELMIKNNENNSSKFYHYLQKIKHKY